LTRHGSKEQKSFEQAETANESHTFINSQDQKMSGLRLKTIVCLPTYNEIRTIW